MSDFLEEKKAEIRARLEQLQSTVDEHASLRAALDAMESSSRSKSHAGGPRRGRPRGTGTRAQEAIAVVTKEPGLTATEIAERMGINHNYLYRVLPSLQDEGKLEKRDRGWFVSEA